MIFQGFSCCFWFYACFSLASFSWLFLRFGGFQEARGYVKMHQAMGENGEVDRLSRSQWLVPLVKLFEHAHTWLMVSCTFSFEMAISGDAAYFGQASKQLDRHLTRIQNHHDFF